MRFPRQEYWSGLLCPPPGDLPDLGIEPISPALQGDSLLLSHHSSNRFLLRTYCAPGTVLDTGGTIVNKISHFIFSHRLYNKGGGLKLLEQFYQRVDELQTDKHTWGGGEGEWRQGMWRGMVQECL